MIANMTQSRSAMVFSLVFFVLGLSVGRRFSNHSVDGKNKAPMGAIDHGASDNLIDPASADLDDKKSTESKVHDESGAISVREKSFLKITEQINAIHNHLKLIRIQVLESKSTIIVTVPVSSLFTDSTSMLSSEALLELSQIMGEFMKREDVMQSPLNIIATFMESNENQSEEDQRFSRLAALSRYLEANFGFKQNLMRFEVRSFKTESNISIIFRF